MLRRIVISALVLIVAGTAIVAHVENVKRREAIAARQHVEAVMRQQRDAINQSILANHYHFQSDIPLMASLRVDAVEFMRHEHVAQFPDVFSVGELVSDSTIESTYPQLGHTVPWLREQRRLAGGKKQQAYLFHTNIWQLTGMAGFEEALCADILLMSTVDDHVTNYWLISQCGY